MPMPSLTLIALVVLALLAWALRRTAAGKPLMIALAIGVLTGGLGQAFRTPGEAGSIAGVELTTLDGVPVTLTGRDRPMVVNLWASWCGPCRAEMPMMMEVAAATGDVDMVFVNQGEDPRRVALYLIEEHLPADRILMDPDRGLSGRFGAFGLPATVFIGADGKMAAFHAGEIPRVELLKRIAALRDATGSGGAGQ